MLRSFIFFLVSLFISQALHGYISQRHERFLVATGQDGNHKAITFYDLNGNFVSVTNLRKEGVTPRGLALDGHGSVLVSGDTNDSILRIDPQGRKQIFHGSSAFNGSIYDLVAHPYLNLIYAIESNRIEVFNKQGLLLSQYRIPTTLGSCTLKSPRGMTINSLGQLVVTNIGGTDNILVYDVTQPVARCLSSTPFGNNPYGILQHSNGFLYITTQGDDRIYRAYYDGTNPTPVWNTNTTIINNPSSLVELPNGNLAVASAATDTIEQITTSGERVGVTPFIMDSHSLNIGGLIILEH